MKKNMFFVIITFVMLITLLSVDKPSEVNYSQSAVGISSFVWIVEPTLDYEDVDYCPMCGYTANNWINILDGSTGQIKGYHNGHGGPYYTEFLYDSINRMFGLYRYGWSEEVKIYNINQFSRQFSSYINTLNFVRQVDSANIIKEDHIDYISYNLGTKYANSKYAISYGSTILTEFVYDKPETSSLAITYNNAIPISKDGKWGFINTRGNIIVPLIFDHAVSSNGDTAFVKINGKYGIIDVFRSATQ